MNRSRPPQIRRCADPRYPQARVIAQPRAVFVRIGLLILAGFLAVALLAGQSVPVQAKDKQRVDANVEGISSGQAANLARASVGGKVLSIRPAGAHFRVKMLMPDGVVTRVRVHRVSGQVSRRGGKNGKGRKRRE